MSTNCLNCGNHLAEKYCGSCGQSSHIHRYSLKHFVEHDLIHGVWHVDKGVLFTLKELLTNPGNSVRDYVLGKRVNYFSFITLLLLILGFSSVLAQYTHIKLSDLMPEASKNAMNAIEKFSTKYPKAMLVITIPITSIFSFLWFRKAKFNYSEHLVLNSYKASVDLLIGLLFTTLTIFYTNAKVLSAIYYFGVQSLLLVYGVWFYYQFFSKSGYTKTALLFRSIMAFVSLMLVSVVIGIFWAIYTMILKH